MTFLETTKIIYDMKNTMMKVQDKRVCNAKRYAGLPWLSLDSPMMRPGMSRLNSSRVDI